MQMAYGTEDGQILKLESGSSYFIMMMKFPFQMLDNGPQYSSDVFQAFSREYGFQHVTSSPNYKWCGKKSS